MARDHQAVLEWVRALLSSESIPVNAYLNYSILLRTIIFVCLHQTPADRVPVGPYRAAI